MNSVQNHAVKFIEIYNATDSEQSLDGCKVIVYKKKSEVIDNAVNVTLSGPIAKGGTHLHCGSYVNELGTDFSGKCNSINSGNLSSISAKTRVIELNCSGKTIDVIGKLGTENTEFSTNIIRNCGITNGVSDPNLVLDYTQWTSIDATIENLKASLGTHKAVCDTTPTE